MMSKDRLEVVGLTPGGILDIPACCKAPQFERHWYYLATRADDGSGGILPNSVSQHPSGQETGF